MCASGRPSQRCEPAILPLVFLPFLVFIWLPLLFVSVLLRNRSCAHALAHSSFYCEWADICKILWPNHRCIFRFCVFCSFACDEIYISNCILDKNYKPTQYLFKCRVTTKTNKWKTVELFMNDSVRTLEWMKILSCKSDQHFHPK